MILPAAVAVYRCAMNALATPGKANRTGGQLGVSARLHPATPIPTRRIPLSEKCAQENPVISDNRKKVVRIHVYGIMWSPFAVTTCCGPNGSTAGRPCGPRSGHDHGGPTVPGMAEQSSRTTVLVRRVSAVLELKCAVVDPESFTENRGGPIQHRLLAAAGGGSNLVSPAVDDQMC